MQTHNNTPLENHTKGTTITANDILQYAEKLNLSFKPKEHAIIFDKLLSTIEPIDFTNEVYKDIKKLREELKEVENHLHDALQNNITGEEIDKLKERQEVLHEKLEARRVSEKHYIIITIDKLLEFAQFNNWDLVEKHSFFYLYNGAFWKEIEEAALKKFLFNAAKRFGVQYFTAAYYKFTDSLYKQFVSMASIPQPEPPEGKVFINLKNGTFEICNETQQLRNPDKNDFLTYQLDFDYNPNATAPIFEKYLQRVLPDKALQDILAEYIGSIFISANTLKLEKALLLYGSGANGKSVFFEIVNAMLGRENISSYSLQNLTNENGYYRAKIANILLNYASEINGKLESSVFKQLVSGEPVDARLPYGNPFNITQYAKLIFNANEYPKEIEHTEAFFRRFLIIPFTEYIPEAEQDKELAKKITSCELSGVFNWVIDGLNRLLINKKFTHSDKVDNAIKDFKKQSNNVVLFIEDENYKTSTDNYVTLKFIYSEYASYCLSSGYHKCSLKEFGRRLRDLGFIQDRKNIGNVIYVIKDVE